MGAVTVFGSPIDKKKYRKFATGVMPALLGAGGYGYFNVTGLAFTPKLVITFTGDTSKTHCNGGFRIVDFKKFNEQFVQGAGGSSVGFAYTTGTIYTNPTDEAEWTSNGFKVYMSSNSGNTHNFTVGWIALA